MRKLLFAAFATIVILGCSNNDLYELPCISCAAKEAGCPNATTGNNTLSCGGQTYKTVVIGTQTWMAENLNYNAAGSKCYKNNESNCQRYGRLYDWFIAKKSCPKGWHLPSDAEWTTLTDFVGSSAGTKLKATSGWNSNGNGTNTYGFAALPGGCGYSDGSFGNVGSSGDWWSASESYSSNACLMGMSYDNEGVYYYYGLVDYNYSYKLRLYSVRCLQD
jgi:uncharacterized protein (TIGR02145 family)